MSHDRLAEEGKGFQGVAEDLYEEPKRKTLGQKMFDIQGEVGAIAKDSDNPFFKSKYFDINALIAHIQPLLKKNRLLLTQPIVSGEVQTIIECIDSGEMRVSVMELPTITDPQKMGSAITYFRRYTLQSLLALQAEDDDGNVASQEAQKPKKESDDEKKWLNATDKQGVLTKNGEYTAQRLFNGETDWKTIYDSVKVSKKDKEAVDNRVKELEMDGSPF